MPDRAMVREVQPRKCTITGRRWAWLTRWCCWAAAGLCWAGCAGLLEREVPPLEDAAVPPAEPRPWATANPLTEKVAVPPGPQEPADPLQPPYRLSTENIVKILYNKGPLVISSRQSMIAAQFGLEEFKANLSRTEPFVRSDATISQFPERRDAESMSGSGTAGIEKETFEGAVLRADGTWRAARTKYGETQEDQEPVVRGDLGTAHGRIEIPFAGSRKRQDRIISVAYQESTARAAKLTYLSNFQTYASQALEQYRTALRYLRYRRSIQQRLDELKTLLNESGVRPADRQRIQTIMSATVVAHQSYSKQYRRSLLTLLQYLGITPDDQYVLIEPPLDRSINYLEQARTPQGRKQMLELAYQNTPKFRVLENDIKDVQLKRAQAITGKLDITATVEGNYFPTGEPGYDDRLHGWQLDSGLVTRLNDQRVLTASQLKAEADIRRYQNAIIATQLDIQNEISDHSARLITFNDTLAGVQENAKKTRDEFENRKRLYLKGAAASSLSIDDVLEAHRFWVLARYDLYDNLYELAENEDRLLIWTGDVYQMVGLKITTHGDIEEPSNRGE